MPDTQDLTPKQKAKVEASVKLTVEKYGETLMRLGDTQDIRELEKELDVYLNNSSWGVNLFAGHRDVLVKEVAKFIDSHVKREVLNELKLIEQLDNTIKVPLRLNILDEVEQYEDLLYKEHFVYIDDRINALTQELKEK